MQTRIPASLSLLLVTMIKVQLKRLVTVLVGLLRIHGRGENICRQRSFGPTLSIGRKDNVIGEKRTLRWHVKTPIERQRRLRKGFWKPVERGDPSAKFNGETHRG